MRRPISPEYNTCNDLLFEWCLLIIVHHLKQISLLIVYNKRWGPRMYQIIAENIIVDAATIIYASHHIETLITKNNLSFLMFFKNNSSCCELEYFRCIIMSKISQIFERHSHKGGEVYIIKQESFLSKTFKLWN